MDVDVFQHLENAGGSKLFFLRVLLPFSETGGLLFGKLEEVYSEFDKDHQEHTIIIKDCQKA